MGKLDWAKMCAEEVDRKHESGCEHRQGGVNYLGDVDDFARHEQAEEAREPEDQPRGANEDDVRACAPEVELLPISPALKG